jgi:hypothetical protein
VQLHLKRPVFLADQPGRAMYAGRNPAVGKGLGSGIGPLFTVGASAQQGRVEPPWGRCRLAEHQSTPNVGRWTKK